MGPWGLVHCGPRTSSDGLQVAMHHNCCSSCLHQAELDCLLLISCKTTPRMCMKILAQMYLCTRENWLNFECHPLLDLDSGVFWRILQHYATVRLISLWKIIRSLWKFYHQCVSLDNEFLSTCGIHANLEHGLWIWTGFALVEVRALCMLLLVWFIRFLFSPLR